MDKPAARPLLKTPHARRMARFGAVGVFNTITDAGVYAGLVALGASPLLANAAGFLCANVQSYIVNAHVTFRGADGRARLSPGGYAKFALGHSLSLVLSSVIIFLTSGSLGPYLAKGLAIACNFLINYWVSARFVFAETAERSRETTDAS
ncbi:MAG: GtrA family protein [Amphiplicatus sp.]|jgi:putative flippase GtrA